MKEQVFRKETLEHISSTEELHDYMHVTSPRLWMLLVAILVLVVGFIAYASTISMENTLEAKADVAVDDLLGRESMDITVEIPEAFQDVVKPDMEVKIGENPGYIVSVYSSGGTTMALARLNDASLILPEGDYDAVITLERVTPISFLFN